MPSFGSWKEGDVPITVEMRNIEVVNSPEGKLLLFKLIINCPSIGMLPICAKWLAVNFAYKGMREDLIRAFATSQFQYRFLIWMLHSRHLNGKINKMQERMFGITY